MHLQYAFKNFKGPTRSINTVMPCFFKRPHMFYHQKGPERKILVRNPVVDTPESRTDGESSSGIEPLACDASTQSDDCFSQKL